MRLKSVFALVLGLACAGSVAAQRPTNLPTSRAPLQTPTSIVTPQAPPPAPALDPENTLHLDLSTGGRVSIQLRPDIAPRHVERMKALVRQGFYNGLVFHRVIDGFMAQGGDPTATGTGGSPLPDLQAEFNGFPHVRGVVSAARASDVNSANSQFFIMLAPRLSLDGQYSVFGRVVSGMNYVDAIEKGEPPANPSRILRASIGADNVAPPAPGEVIPQAAPVAAPSPANPGTPAGDQPATTPQP